jgi:hypothetical protein
VPTEIKLGSFPPGSRIPIRFTVRNPGTRSIEFEVTSNNPAVSLLTRRLTARARAEATIIGVVAIGAVAPGQRIYRIRFEIPTPLETNLVVEVVPAFVRVEFVPPEFTVADVQPGTIVHRNLTLNNTGNVIATADITVTEPWLSVHPTCVALSPGESCLVRVTARTHKTDFGKLSGQIRFDSMEGFSSIAEVFLQLPQPILEALPVDFGEVTPDRPAYQAVVLRNTGKVRVACSLRTDQSWLAVTPNHVNLPAGGEKEVKLRAQIPTEEAGIKTAGLIASFAGGELLRVPVSINCLIPRPILGSIRKQTLGAVASDAAVVRRFRVSNTGDGLLNCKIEANQPWIEILTKTISVFTGKKRRIEYRIDTPLMNKGINRATIQIRSNGGEADVPVSIVVVDPEPKLGAIDDLDFGTVDTSGAISGQLMVRNSGVGMLKLKAVPRDSRVTVTPSELTLAPGPPAKLAVAVALDGLSGGTYSYAIRFSSNGGNASASLKFRLPIEQIDVPAVIDLSNQLVGRPTDHAVHLMNSGPDDIKLAVRSEDPWIQPQVGSFSLRAGEIFAVPIRIRLRQGMSGLVKTAIWLEGRTIRRKVEIQAMARRIELRAIPDKMDLGVMAPGEERAFVLQVMNRGDMVAEIRDLHVPGDLEIWVRRQIIQPLVTIPLVGRVRMNSRTLGRQVVATLRLGDEVAVLFSSRVVQARTQRILTTLSGVSALAAGTAVWVTNNWLIGLLVALFGLAIGVGVWVSYRAR